MRFGEINLEGYLFMVDCNAFMHDHFLHFMKNELVLAIKKYREETGRDDGFVYIPKTVKEELETLRERPSTSNIGSRTEAVRGYAAMEDLVLKGYGRLVKSDFTGAAGGFNDVAMLTMLMELRRHSDIAVLSNDRDFATDLLTLNNLKSVDSKKLVRVFYIGLRSGRFSEWKLHPELREAERFPNELVKGGQL